MNMSNVFLHEDFKEEVYTTQLLGFKSTYPHKVYQLQKSLYGLL